MRFRFSGYLVEHTRYEHPLKHDLFSYFLLNILLVFLTKLKIYFKIMRENWTKL